MKKGFFKKFQMLVSATLILTLTGPVLQANAASDVATSWAGQDIQALLDKGIISGYPDGSFQPNQIMTRAEFVSVLNRFNGLQTSSNSSTSVSFTDVKPTNWFYSAVEAAVKSGYVAGYQDGSFRPNEAITRQEAAQMLSRLLHLTNQSGQTLSFTDKDKIGNWAVDSIAAAVQNKLIAGYPDGSFAPNKGVTRAEVAAMVFNALKISTTNTSQGAESFQVKLSGATEAPQVQGTDPANGILIAGSCSIPDGTAIFDKSATVTNPQGGKDPNHIVFAVQLTPQSNGSTAPSEGDLVKNATVKVNIYGADNQLVESVNLPQNDKPDFYTHNPFFVNCIWLTKMAGQTGLAKGDYTYKFEATITDGNGQSNTSTWAPENNTFTVIDSSQN